MSEGTDGAWFAGIDPTDTAAAATALRTGRADAPAAWPATAVERGVVADESAYYEQLREATLVAAQDAVEEREQADDQQLIHLLRAHDDCQRQANELAERVSEWGGSRLEETGHGIAYARQVTDHDPDDAVEQRLVALAERCVDLDEEAATLETELKRLAPSVAPNLATLAGPLLAARLIALAGGLEALAKLPSSTVQVLGAEDALFAHLRGDASSPKHGVIYTHEYVQEVPNGEQGSAARALAGKLTIAARIDYYAGDRRPALEEELEERIATIRARGESA